MKHTFYNFDIGHRDNIKHWFDKTRDRAFKERSDRRFRSIEIYGKKKFQLQKEENLENMT